MKVKMSTPNGGKFYMKVNSKHVASGIAALGVLLELLDYQPW